jgi:hypothetical protein
MPFSQLTPIHSCASILHFYNFYTFVGHTHHQVYRSLSARQHQIRKTVQGQEGGLRRGDEVCR